MPINGPQQPVNAPRGGLFDELAKKANDAYLSGGVGSMFSTIQPAVQEAFRGLREDPPSAGAVMDMTLGFDPSDPNIANIGVEGLLAGMVTKKAKGLKKLWRETNLEGLEEFIPTGAVSYGGFGPREWFASDMPELAIGQGHNKGVMMQLDPADFKAVPHNKPGTIPGLTGVEYRLTSDAPRTTGFKIDKNVPQDKVMVRRLGNMLRQLEKEGWTKIDSKDFVEYSPPKAK